MSRICCTLVWVPATLSIALLACSETVGPDGAGRLTVHAQLAPGTRVALDGGRVHISGPTNRTQDIAPGTTETISGLAPGSYTVSLEGLVQGEVEVFGQTNVQVVAGNNSVANVTLSSFRPTLTSLGGPITALRRLVNYSAVQNAESYIVEWDSNSNFSSPLNTTSSGTSAEIVVADTGAYFVRVRATNSFQSNGRASASATFSVVTDVTSSGGNAAEAPRIGSGMTVDTTLTELSIFPVGDEDWFAVRACEMDTLEIETFAARLGPASDLETRLELYDSAGAVLLAADSNLAKPDSRISFELPTDALYSIQVTSEDGSAGHYELMIRVRPGPSNTGTDCIREVANLVFTTQPTSAVAGAVIVPPIRVELHDADGNIIPQASNPVTLSIASNPEDGILAGTTSANALNGVVIFADISIETAGQGYTLRATTSGASGTVSSSPSIAFDIAPGPATQLVFVVQPSPIVETEPFSPSPVVAAQDQFGNTATSHTGLVTLSIINGPVGGNLLGATARTLSNGLATFAGLSVDLEGFGYRLAASTPGLAVAQSVSFTVDPGPPPLNPEKRTAKH